jgi:hypothetical protein
MFSAFGNTGFGGQQQQQQQPSGFGAGQSTFGSSSKPKTIPTFLINTTPDLILTHPPSSIDPVFL